MLTTLLILPHNIVNNCDFRAILHSFVMFWMFHAHHHCHWKFWLFWGQGLLDWLQNCVKSSIDFLLSESWQVLLQVSQPRDICSQYRLQHFRIDKYLVTAKYPQSSKKKIKHDFLAVKDSGIGQYRWKLMSGQLTSLPNCKSIYIKGILHQKIFYRLNLIFWIVMGCGIADFDRRGL